MLTKRIYTSVAAIALMNSMPASAALIQYTLSGIGGGSLNGISYSGPFVATALGDTSFDYNPSTSITAFLTSPLQIKFGGNVLTSTLPVLFFTNNAVSAGGFVQLNPGGVGSGVHSVTFNKAAAFGTYRGDTNIGSLPVTFELFPPQFQFLDTDQGRLTWTPGAFQNITFSAESPTASVPEPASWALMIAGFGLIGGAMRRRQSVRVIYA